MFAVLSSLLALALAAVLIAVRGDGSRSTARWSRCCSASGCACCCYGPIGVGVGALIRNQIAAVVAALAWTFIVEQLLVALFPDIGKWTPGGAATRCCSRRARDAGVSCCRCGAGRCC